MQPSTELMTPEERFQRNQAQGLANASKDTVKLWYSPKYRLWGMCSADHLMVDTRWYFDAQVIATFLPNGTLDFAEEA